MKTRSRNSLVDGLPDDLCKWVSPALLGEWIEEQIGWLDWDNPGLQALLRANPEFRPKVLLRVLTLGYARGVTDSQTIADKCTEDPLYQDACGREVPGGDDLIAFREKNRALLEGMLGEVMKRVVKKQFGRALLPQPVKRYISHLASLRLDCAELEDRRLLAA